MLSGIMLDFFSQLIGEKLHVQISSLDYVRISGGSINDTYKLTVNKNHCFFLKVNSSQHFPALFEKEKSGLEFLRKQNVIRAPQITGNGITGDEQWLLMEWIEPGGKTKAFWKIFGEQLARLHQISHSHFGFTENNYMGALPQTNTLSKNWIDFFIGFRLQPQIQLARNKGLLTQNNISSFGKLYAKLDVIFNEENASLLHGDLWNGNFICDANNLPVLIDPAVYFGHRNMDLAMTTLFGGFDKSFYESYHYYFPLPHNHQEQWDVCNLYPLLIHLNLFGSSYHNDIEVILKKFNG